MTEDTVRVLWCQECRQWREVPEFTYDIYRQEYGRVCATCRRRIFWASAEAALAPHVGSSLRRTRRQRRRP